METKKSQNLALHIALIATLLAIGAQLYLSQHFYDMKFGHLTGPSICNVNDYMNCDTVTASRYASFLGIPMALWGVFTNLILLLFLGFTRWNLTSDRERTGRYTFTLSAVVAAASVVMASISIGTLHALCLFCVSAYVLSLINLAAVWWATRPTFKGLRHDLTDTLFTQHWVLGFVAAIPVLAYLVNMMVLESQGFGDIAKIANEKVAYWEVATPQTFDLGRGIIHQRGTAEPAMTIVEFADYLCPHCRVANPVLNSFTDSHPDVRLIFKPFPLDGVCNAAVKQSGNGVRCSLAYYSFCSEKLFKKGHQVHSWIFDHQEDMETATSESAAKSICDANGMNCEELLKCAASEDVILAVKKAADEGDAAGVQGTPTVYINGRKLEAGTVMPVLDAVYQKIKQP
jgi:uncharacterized membrane protein